MVFWYLASAAHSDCWVGFCRQLAQWNPFESPSGVSASGMPDQVMGRTGASNISQSSHGKGEVVRCQRRRIVGLALKQCAAHHG